MKLTIRNKISISMKYKGDDNKSKFVIIFIAHIKIF